jgi:hypothetical protein
VDALGEVGVGDGDGDGAKELEPAVLCKRQTLIRRFRRSVIVAGGSISPSATAMTRRLWRGWSRWNLRGVSEGFEQVGCPKLRESVRKWPQCGGGGRTRLWSDGDGEGMQRVYQTGGYAFW